MKNCLRIFSTFCRAKFKRTYFGFSLVELLMALLVASLLMSALAPVITKKFGDNVNVTGNMSPAGAVRKTVEIEYNSTECNDIKTASDGSQYCEGEFEVPGGYNGMMKITLVGAGGGGAAASTAGYTEFTTVGETNNFKVPYDVNEIEATLVSGGAGGGAGGQVLADEDFSSKDGKISWTPLDIAIGNYVKVTGCGGGGGGAGQRGRITAAIGGGAGGGGGSGAYGSTTLYVPNKNPWEIHIGGGGGGGSIFGCNNGNNGGYFAGGGGGGGTNGTNVQLGYGGGAGTETGGIGGKACATSNNSDGQRNGVSATPAGGGEGGARTTVTGNLRTNTGAAGGSGGAYAGGGGGGGVRGQSAGGGGGGATRLIINNTLAAIWPGGGGGSSSSGVNWPNSNNEAFLGGAGGGGGGAGGGKGGNAVDTWYGNTPTPPHRSGNPGLGGYSSLFSTKADGNGPYGGKIVLENYAFGDENCHGGDSYEPSTDIAMGKNGKRGALKISYLDYGISGGGGGGAGMVPLRKVPVTPGETLKIKVGRGGKGGTTGSIKDDGTIKQPTSGEDAFSNTAERNCVVSRISKADGEVLLTTSYTTNYAGPLAGATNGGTFPYHSMGSINDGKPAPPNANGAIVVAGFTNTSGGVGAKKSTGGDGGIATTPFTGTCEAGKGGNASSPNGTNATGYGCGGGGGYSYFGNGGAGSSGYARISWNKYYDAVQKLYKLAEFGAGGGGASGNVFAYSISVKSNEIFTFRIGKGGNGGNGSFAQSNNAEDVKKLNGTKGGDTIFAVNTSRQLIAGGGDGGIFPSINSTILGSTSVNGRGGAVSNVCTYNGKSYLNTEKYCKKGLPGNDAQANIGGAGADFKTLTVKVVDSMGKETDKQISGIGGLGGIAGVNSHGGHSENSYGAGGGGAGLWDLGEVSSSGMSNPSKGGNGSNGKIIIEWWEL